MQARASHHPDPADALQDRLVRYAQALTYASLDRATVDAARVRIIDTLAAAVGGFDDEAACIARALATHMKMRSGATIVGTALKVPVDMAAFVNATAARAVELNDVYHRPGSRNGHPSDVIMPLLAVAEHAGAGGEGLIAAVVLAYEVYLRFADAARNKSFDATNFCCLATAIGAAQLLGAAAHELAHAISLALVPNNALNQTRTGHLSMWKSAAAGQAGRAGVFAAMLAREGMEGPCLPFTGKHGWCSNVAREEIALDVMGGEGVPYKIHESFVKPRAACLHTLAPILAAEKVATVLKHTRGRIESVMVEVYEAKERSLGGAGNSAASGEHHWNPQSRETADHSIPYCVAATLIDGTITPRSFDEARIHDPALRKLLARVKLTQNADYTEAYERIPVRYRARVTVVTDSGEAIIGETGGEHGDLSDAMDEAAVSAKFAQLVGPALGAAGVRCALDALRGLAGSTDVSTLPPLFAGVSAKTTAIHQGQHD